MFTAPLSCGEEPFSASVSVETAVSPAGSTGARPSTREPGTEGPTFPWHKNANTAQGVCLQWGWASPGPATNKNKRDKVQGAHAPSGPPGGTNRDGGPGRGDASRDALYLIPTTSPLSSLVGETFLHLEVDSMP